MVGDRDEVVHEAPARGCFNGDPTSWSGIGPSSRCSTRPSCRFNGAPTSWSGIDACRILHENRHYLLQRSPDLVVGDRRCSGPRSSSRPGFNGAPTSWSGIAWPRPRTGTPRTRFNGAPTSWSGIGPSPRRQYGTDARFNGAPTSWSGIGERPARADARDDRFNGAPTSWSGIVAVWCAREALLRASTEPRPRGRGSR